MADWGKINRGSHFVMLTTDVLRAVSVVQWGRYEWPIIGYLIEHSWGTATRTGKRGQFQSPIPCAIPVRPLARATGLPANRISEAKADLIAGNVVIACGDGWTFNKNAEEWKEADGTTPRLTPELAFYCHSFTTESAPPQRYMHVPPQRNGRSAPAEHACTAPAERALRPSGTPDVRPPDPPIGETRASEDLRREEREEEARPPQIQPFDPQATEADRKAAREIIERWGGDAIQADSMARSWRTPMRFVLAALEETTTKIHRVEWSYARKIAIRLRDGGTLSANGAPAKPDPPLNYVDPNDPIIKANLARIRANREKQKAASHAK